MVINGFNADTLTAALDEAGIDNDTERAMFLSQMAHETGNFKWDEELSSGKAYEGRKDLGNTEPGDGKKYKGRGFIQLTGKTNYKKFGDKIGVDLVSNPDLAKDPKVAAKVAIEYWKERVDREAAQNGNVLKVTKNINGGTNGLADRSKLFDEYYTVMTQKKSPLDVAKEADQYTAPANDMLQIASDTTLPQEPSLLDKMLFNPVSAAEPDMLDRIGYNNDLTTRRPPGHGYGGVASDYNRKLKIAEYMSASTQSLWWKAYLVGWKQSGAEAANLADAGIDKDDIQVMSGLIAAKLSKAGLEYALASFLAGPLGPAALSVKGGGVLLKLAPGLKNAPLAKFASYVTSAGLQSAIADGTVNATATAASNWLSGRDYAIYRDMDHVIGGMALSSVVGGAIGGPLQMYADTAALKAGTQLASDSLESVMNKFGANIGEDSILASKIKAKSVLDKLGELRTTMLDDAGQSISYSIANSPLKVGLDNSVVSDIVTKVNSIPDNMLSGLSKDAQDALVQIKSVITNKSNVTDIVTGQKSPLLLGAGDLKVLYDNFGRLSEELGTSATSSGAKQLYNHLELGKLTDDVYNLLPDDVRSGMQAYEGVMKQFGDPLLESSTKTDDIWKKVANKDLSPDEALQFFSSSSPSAMPAYTVIGELVKDSRSGLTPQDISEVFFGAAAKANMSGVKSIVKPAIAGLEDDYAVMLEKYGNDLAASDLAQAYVDKINSGEIIKQGAHTTDKTMIAVNDLISAVSKKVTGTPIRPLPEPKILTAAPDEVVKSAADFIKTPEEAANIIKEAVDPGRRVLEVPIDATTRVTQDLVADPVKVAKKMATSSNKAAMRAAMGGGQEAENVIQGVDKAAGMLGQLDTVLSNTKNLTSKASNKVDIGAARLAPGAEAPGLIDDTKIGTMVAKAREAANQANWARFGATQAVDTLNATDLGQGLSPIGQETVINPMIEPVKTFGSNILDLLKNAIFTNKK